MSADPQPCDGVKVVDLTQGMAGPMATMVLADYGADVVKVEPPGGDWARGRLRGFHMWNRGKRSIALDLDEPAGRHDLAGLVRWADVVVTDTGPSASARLGITHDDLLAVNPAVIHCHLGTWAGAGDDDEPVYEGQFAAASGQMAGRDLLSGRIVEPTRTDPTFTLPPTNSFGAAMLAVQGVLAALLARLGAGAAGPGELVSTSLAQGAMAFLMRQDLARPIAAVNAAGDDLMHRGIELCFLTAECADGRYIQMCARQDHHFRAWLDALGLTELLTDERFAKAPLGIRTHADVDELERLLRERMRTRTQAEWMRTFTTDYDLGADPFLTPEEFLEHPQMVDNARVAHVDDPVLGETTQVGQLVTIDGRSRTRFAAAPRLDADGATVRATVIEQQHDRAPAPPAATATPRRLPLEGVTILEIAYFVAGPLATTMMAELGARVIKVEPLDGDPYRRTGMQSAKFLAGKESIALDLKHPDARRVVHDLIRASDALIHGFRAGVPERLGIDEATARALRPGIVYLNAASYGSKGPEAGRIAFHSTPTALSGAGIAQAGRGNKPVDDSFPDPAAGLGAATALALGLYAQRRFGTGSSLETTMLASTGYVMSNDTVVAGGCAHAAIVDAEQLGLDACYRLYECADGWMFLAAAGDGAVERLSKALELEAPRDTELVEHSDAQLAAAVAAACATRTVDATVAALRAHRVPASAVSLATVDLWLEQAGLLEPAHHPAFGDFYQPRRKIDFPGRSANPRPVCVLGEHTTALLAEIGRTPAEIDALLESRAASAPADRR